MPHGSTQGDVMKETNNHKQGRSGGQTPTKTGPAVGHVKHNGGTKVKGSK